MKRFALLVVAGLLLSAPVLFEVATNTHTKQVLKNTKTWIKTNAKNAKDRRVAKRITAERCRQASG